MRRINLSFMQWLCLAGLLSALPLSAQVKVEQQVRRVYDFPTAGVQFNNKFSGARLSGCTQTGPNSFRVLIQPEHFPINDSPWFAFQVVAHEAKTITVTLVFEHGRARYHPKISHDGVTWETLGDNAWKRDARDEAVVTLAVGPKVLWVAAQELVTAKDFETWMDGMAQKPFVKKSLVAHSMQNRPLNQIEISESRALNYVFIIGRQHPPEVTGTFALMAFCETLAGNTELGKNFRQHFHTVIIPLMNPDGVENGHWRDNMGGVDLNRDWKDFAQPETRQVRDHLLKLAKQPGAKPFLMLDFHSTATDRFYTQLDSQKTFPPDFTVKWLGAITQRFPDYQVKREPTYHTEEYTSKIWGYKTFGIPDITYELGDNTDRAWIKQIATGAAEEMMKLLLAEVK